MDIETLYEHAPCGFLSTTSDGTIVRVNQTLCDRTGYTADDLVGKRRFADLLTGGGRIYHETHYAPMLELEGRVREIALDIVAADGRRLPALVNSVLERGHGGRTAMVHTAIFDATERRLYEQELLRSKQRAEESEAHAQLLSRTLQRTLIPPAAPDVPGLDVAAAYRPAGSGNEIGGDFYDIFEIAEDDWIVAVGDVCGKGIDAAVITGAARYAIRGAAVREPAPSAVLSTLNLVLLHHDSDRFCTVALVRMRRGPNGWVASIALAGHPAPILCRPDGPPRAVGRLGIVAGINADARFHEVDVALRPGEELVVFTDGVTEGRRGREFFGEARLIATLGRGAPSAQGLVDRTLSTVMDFQYEVPRDDIVVVVLRAPERVSP